MQIKVGQIYKHYYNGYLYEVLDILSEDEYNETQYIIYKGLHDQRRWIRPAANFQFTKIDGRQRFQLVSV